MRFPDPEPPESPPVSGQRPRCAVCHDVIGVYEPLVHVFEGLVWRTSRAAEPAVAGAAGTLYHAGCYERMGTELAPETS